MNPDILYSDAFQVFRCSGAVAPGRCAAGVLALTAGIVVISLAASYQAYNQRDLYI